jgi:hypothetical protein
MRKPKSAPKSASAIQITRFGHVASLLRSEMDKRKWTVSDMNRAMGLPRGHVGVYKWLSSKGAPAEINARKLGKILNLPWEQFLGNFNEAPITRTMPGQALVPSPPRRNEVLSFNVADNGESRIRLDITLPTERGVALLRILLDAGMVMSQ